MCAACFQLQEKKEKKGKKEKKEKKEKREKRSKKEKEEKSAKKRRREDLSSERAAAAVDQSKYGAYGIIREADFFSKQREFEAWMTEVKGIEASGGKREMMEHFKSFAEDYNTVTMPNKKWVLPPARAPASPTPQSPAAATHDP
jgi:N12 class adenine-specific DNA methylase